VLSPAVFILFFNQWALRRVENKKQTWEEHFSFPKTQIGKKTNKQKTRLAMTFYYFFLPFGTA